MHKAQRGAHRLRYPVRATREVQPLQKDLRSELDSNRAAAVTDARRAAHAYNPRNLWVFVVAAFLIILIAIDLANGRRSSQAAPPPPQPTATWTSYLPTTPQVCRDAMEAADRMHQQAIVTIDAAVKAAAVNINNNPAAAKKQIDVAVKANNQFTDAENAYLKLAKGCKK
jgi:hypothetical protein